MKRAMAKPHFGIPWTEHSRLTDLDFADDIALMAKTQKVLQEATTSLEEEAARVGLRISTDKTKTLKVTRKTQVQVSVGNQQIEEVNQFTYLGSIVASTGGADADINCRIGKAAAVFRQLRPIWSRRTISMATNVRFFQ